MLFMNILRFPMMLCRYTYFPQRARFEIHLKSSGGPIESVLVSVDANSLRVSFTHTRQNIGEQSKIPIEGKFGGSIFYDSNIVTELLHCCYFLAVMKSDR